MIDEFIFYHPEVVPELAVTGPSWYHLGHRAWIVQAYQQLRQRGFPCVLSHKFPREGVIIGFRTTFPNDARPTEKRFLVCVQADYPPVPYSNADIVQNPAQARTRRGRSKYYIPLFPQTGLIPRAEEYGDRFTRVGYFGRLYGINRSPVLESPDFRRWLAGQTVNHDNARVRHVDGHGMLLLLSVAVQRTIWRDSPVVPRAWKPGQPCPGDLLPVVVRSLC